MIRFACPICRKVIKAPEHGAGREIRCPRCSQRLVIPFPVQDKAIVGQLLPDSPSSSPLPLPAAGPPATQLPEQALVYCPGCNSPFKVSEERLGKGVECPKCGMGFAEVAEEPSLAPGLPAASPACEPPPIRREDYHSTASEPLVDTFESASADDTHTSDPPGPSATQPERETPFEGIQPDAPSWLTPPAKHSTQGIVSTVGAAAIFVMVLFSISHFEGIAAKIRAEKGPEMAKQLTKLDQLRTVSKWVGFSGAAFGLFWSGVSFFSMTKVFWKIVACGANGVLLVWILFR